MLDYLLLPINLSPQKLNQAWQILRHTIYVNFENIVNIVIRCYWHFWDSYCPFLSSSYAHALSSVLICWKVQLQKSNQKSFYNCFNVNNKPWNIRFPATFDEIALAIQGFYFLVKCGLVLIYILKVYCKNSFSILLTKNMFNSLLAFFFWKACTCSCFERFLCWKSRNYSQQFFSEIYLSRIINYWSSIFTLYLTWGAFTVVRILSVFFSFFLFFFLFLSVFSLTDTNYWQDYRWGRRKPYFPCFSISPVTNIHLVHWDFYHFFLIYLLVITRLRVIDFDISKWHCEDLSSYQNVTLLLQSKPLNCYILFLYCNLFC